MKGFDIVFWDATQLAEAYAVGVSYLYTYMEECYPGYLNVKVTYVLNNENELKMHYLDQEKSIHNLASINCRPKSNILISLIQPPRVLLAIFN